MNDRIKKIRKELDLTQQEFAERLGIKRNTIATYESGRNKPIDAVVSLICREFNVSEDWLRNGIGDMFLPTNRRSDIEKLTNQLLNEDEDSFKNRFVSMLADLSVTEWEFLEKRLKQLYESKYIDQEEPAETSVQDAEAEYIKSRSESAKKQERSALSTTADTDRKLG